MAQLQKGWLAMARLIRVGYIGTTYNLMGRRNHGKAIYANDEERRMLLETMAEACENATFWINVFVMMNDYFHPLLEIPAGNLVAGMNWLQSTSPIATTRGTGCMGICFKRFAG